MIAPHVTMSQSGKNDDGKWLFWVGALPTEANSVEYKIDSPRRDPSKIQKSFQ